MYADRVLALLKERDGLSDREIADKLLGRDSPQQTTNQTCRNLFVKGLIRRCQRADGIIGNFLFLDVIKGAKTPNLKVNANIGAMSKELVDGMRQLGVIWAASDLRPRIKPHIRSQWEKLIDEWAADPEMPLVVRKSGGVRGSTCDHRESGRKVIWADNSPALWAFSCALRDCDYTLDQIRTFLFEHRIPFAFAVKATDKHLVTHRGTVAICGVDLNKRGWKLCHIDEVALRTKTPIGELSTKTLTDHFRRLMKPSNHFVVPLRWAGFGEIPEVIEEVQRYDRSTT